MDQVMEGPRQVVSRWHQAGTMGNDAVSVVVGVAAEGNVEASLQAYQALHGIGGGRIHSDAPIPVHGHKAECRIDLLADDREIESVALGDGRPVVHTGAAEWIHAHA